LRGGGVHDVNDADERRRSIRHRCWPAKDLDAFDVTQARSEEHTSELQSRRDLVCRLLLEKKKKKTNQPKNSQQPTSQPIIPTRQRLPTYPPFPNIYPVHLSASIHYLSSVSYHTTLRVTLT